MSDIARQLNESAMNRQAQSKAHYADQVAKLQDDVAGGVACVIVITEDVQHSFTAARTEGGRRIVALFDAAPDLLEHLEDWVSQHGCTCGHRHCNACERTRATREVIQRAKGVTG